MNSTTFTVRVDADIKKRLERLAKSTGRTRSFLAAEAIAEYLKINEWQVAGIKRAMASLDRGEGIPNASVKDWVASWGSANEKVAGLHRTRRSGGGATCCAPYHSKR